MFAIVAPLLLAFAGAGVDYARYYKIKAYIQDAADQAALTGARQFAIRTSDTQLPETLAKQTAERILAAHADSANAAADAVSNTDEATVTVSIKDSYKPTLFVSMFKNPMTVYVEAVAQAVGGANICVIALEAKTNRAMLMDDDASLSGDDCAVYVNSSGNKALTALDNSTLKTSFNCTSGGYDGGIDNFHPTPLTDCPVREDPLIDRVAPTVSICDQSGEFLEDMVTTLLPGVYCDGLTIGSNADVTLSPGVYIIKDGPLKIGANAEVMGENVGFYFIGANSVLDVEKGATLSLTAPRTGEMAGLLLFEDRDAPTNRKFRIGSNNAKTLVGTIYLPKGRLVVDADEPVASASAYTAIIAQRLELHSTVNLVLNSNYSATDVPVPPGVGSTDGNVMLRR